MLEARWDEHANAVIRAPFTHKHAPVERLFMSKRAKERRIFARCNGLFSVPHRCTVEVDEKKMEKKLNLVLLQ